MPHSFGGGSSHGGSHHSSFSSSSSSSYHSAPKTHIRSSYFPGSRVYVRYVNRRPTYMYSDGDINSSGVNWIAVVVLIVMVLFGALALFGSVNKPTKLTWDDVDSTEVDIVDNAGIIDDKTSLRKCLEDFRDYTGVIPSILTVSNSDWMSSYPDLEQYAYNMYVYQYSDEKHWLIVYSEDSNSYDMFGDWYWEGMQGDDTDGIITESVANAFTDTLHNNFLASNRYTKTQAIVDAFNSIREPAMSMHIDSETAVSSIIIVLVCSVVCAATIIQGVARKVKYGGYEWVRNVQMAPNNLPVEDVCKYCDGIYVVGTVLNCPHCGASLPPHNPYNA